MRSLRDIDVKGKRVLMRVDFNVPLSGREVADDTRIRASLPSINYVLENGGKLVLMSHLGRPKGKRDETLSLKPVAESLGKLLDRKIRFMPRCLGEENESASCTMAEGDVMLLENTRFHSEETSNDSGFAKELARLGDVYVNDAFGSAHRAHASVEAVTRCFKEKAPGFLMEKELTYLSELLGSPKRPFVTVLGGAKVSGKTDVIRNLLPRVDRLLLGGAMIFTFFKSMGHEIGSSLLEKDKLSLARELLDDWGKKILLPRDVSVGREFDKDTDKKQVDVDKIEEGWIGLDIGEKTIAEYQGVLAAANTIFWNGPMGVFEFPRFEAGTRAIASRIAEKSTGKDSESAATTIVGGGDTIAAIHKFGYVDRMTHVSTGGGASLEFLAGLTLPGVEALK
jgi:phosphoglycerate kinase